MKRIIIIIFVALAAGAYGWVSETGTLEEFVYGHNDSLSYDNWLSHVVEGIADEDYNLYAPYDRQTSGFGSYSVPTAAQLEEWRAITDALVSWDYAQVDTLLAATELPFELVEFNDTVSDNIFWIIREQLNYNYVDDNGTPDWEGDDERGSFDYGWGLFIFNPLASYPVVITTPHINDDFPTVPAAVELYRASDAYVYIASGVGREVLYDNQYGYYTNSFSLCDPSRQEDTVFNSVYQSSCDYMRETYGHRELSIQIHSYDWNRHQWYANCQISAGWGKGDPGVPIRDYSDFGLDIAHANGEWIHEANAVGIHPAVHLNDFYAFNCSTYPFEYTDEDTTFAINTSMDLPGYRYNKQMTYTSTGLNEHLTFEPFFHIEMDELPNCYPQTEANYYWFWGYDPITQRYDYEHIFDRCQEFYLPWINGLAAVIPPLFENDDNAIPTAVTPLEIVSANYNRVALSWERTNSYDYDTYEILYSTEPIANGNYDIWDKGNDSDFNNAAGNWTEIFGLEPNTEYYFQARVRDVNDNISELSNEVSCLTGPARLRYEKAVAHDGYITFTFNAQFQDDNGGFFIYRKADDEPDYSLVDSYETNGNLVALNEIDNYTYTWVDSSVTNWVEYSYIAASSDLAGNQYWHNYPVSATAFDMYTLHFMHEDSLLTDEIWFGATPNASDGFDSDYDLDQDEEPVEDYVFAEFYEEDWDSHQSMIRQIEGGYNFDTSLKSWVFRVKSNQYNDDISLSALGQFIRDGRKLYLVDESLGLVVDLLEEDYLYTNTTTGWRYFRLYWGNLLPGVDFANPANHIYQAGELVSFSWNISNNFLVENFDVYIESPTDEIQLSSSLPPFFGQINWTVPEGLMLENARITIDLLMIDGDRRQYTSGFEFGCVPSAYSYTVPAGLHLVSNPFTDEDDIPTLLGNADIYELTADGYVPGAQFMYGTGYFSESEQGYITVVEALVEGGNEQFELQQGWNILPNPHLAGCWRDDIIIISPDLEMTFAEAVQYNLVECAVFSYAAGWHETDYIYPTEAVLMYCHQSSLQAKFVPYNNNHNWLIKGAAEYSVELNASQSQEINDKVVLQLNPLATDDFDLLYDLPQPCDNPSEHNISFCTVIDSQYSFSKFYQESRNTYDLENERLDWEFELAVEEIEPVTFRLNCSDLPEDVVIMITIAGVEYDLSREGEFVFVPEEEVTAGMISFVPEWMEGSEDNIPGVLSLKNYPNPFYAGSSRDGNIKIACSIPEAQQVDLAVYNIKGQKVAQLVNEQLEAGTHQINWNMMTSTGKTAASGIYFSRLSTKGKETCSKLVIIR